MVRKAVHPLAEFLAVCSLAALVTPRPAEAFELSGGVNVGGVLLGTRPRFAVSPHAGIAWRTEGGFLLALRDAFGILPAINERGIGVYNHTSVAIGYAWTSGRFSIGPSLAIYSAPACGQEWCARLTGSSPGVVAQVDYYFHDPLGVSAITTVDWLTGSDVLPAGVAVTMLVGPVLKWSDE